MSGPSAVFRYLYYPLKQKISKNLKLSFLSVSSDLENLVITFKCPKMKIFGGMEHMKKSAIESLIIRQKSIFEDRPIKNLDVFVAIHSFFYKVFDWVNKKLSKLENNVDTFSYPTLKVESQNRF